MKKNLLRATAASALSPKTHTQTRRHAVGQILARTTALSCRHSAGPSPAPTDIDRQIEGGDLVMDLGGHLIFFFFLQVKIHSTSLVNTNVIFTV